MKKILIALAFVVACGISAKAADTKYHVGLGLMDSLPMSSDFKDLCKSSLGLNLSGDYMITDQFAAGVEIGDVFGYEIKANTSYKVKDMAYGVRGKYIKPMDFGSKKGNIYGILGIASYNWSTDPKTTTDSEIGFSLGVGAEMEIAPQWLIGLEVRYHMVKDGSTTDDSLAPMISAGYTF